MNLTKLFSRKPKRRELAPQITRYERRTLSEPGVPPAGLPYATYNQMQTDAMVQTALTVKKLGVLAAPWKLEPADGSSEAKRRAEFVEEAFARMEGSPSTILSNAMDAFAKGWSIQESVYEPDGDHVWLAVVRAKDPAHFGLDMDAFGRMKGLTLRLPGEIPLDLPRDKFVVYQHRSGYGNAKGTSDLDAAHKHWQAKQTLLAAWKLHLERFAMPTVLGKYARGLPATEQTELLASLDNLHRLTSILYPDEIELTTLGGSKEPSTGFMEALDFHNREIARAILGQTLTTDEGRRVGSLAMGKVHLQVLLLQLEAIRKDLADRVMTEQVVRPLVEMNFGPGLVPAFVFESSSAEAFVTGSL